MLALKIGVIPTKTKKFWQLPEAGRGKEWILSWCLQQECDPANTCFQMSGL